MTFARFFLSVYGLTYIVFFDKINKNIKDANGGNNRRKGGGQAGAKVKENLLWHIPKAGSRPTSSR